MGSAKKPIKNSLVKPTIWGISCFLRTFARKFSNIDWSSRGPRELGHATLTWDGQKSCAETISANVLKWRLSYQPPTATRVSAAMVSYKTIHLEINYQKVGKATCRQGTIAASFMCDVKPRRRMSRIIINHNYAISSLNVQNVDNPDIVDEFERRTMP